LTSYCLKYIFCAVFAAVTLLASAQKPTNPVPAEKIKVQHRFSAPVHHYTDTLLINSTDRDSPPIRPARFIPLPALPKAAASQVQSKPRVLGGLSLDIHFTGTTCEASNGSIAVAVSGGVGPYQFGLNGSTYQDYGAFAGLAAGAYAISVKDANGLTGSGSCTLTNTYAMPKLEVVSSTDPSGCANFDGGVTLSASGGTSPYTFSDDEINYQPGNLFNGLSPGSYSFLARDAHGCFAAATNNLFLTCTGTFNFGGYVGGYACVNNGSLNIVQVANGTPPYSFSLDDRHYQPTGKFDNLTPGRYHLYIRDATGRTMVYTFPVHPFCPILVAAVTTDADCAVANGAISITGSQGKTPYLYSIDGVNFQSSAIFQGLAPGSYTVEVKDADGFTGSLSDVLVGSPCPIPLKVSGAVTNARCGSNNGSITISASGGTPPYRYSLDGMQFQTNNVFGNLGESHFTIWAEDALGAQQSAMAQVTNTVAPDISVRAVNSGCDNDGSITIMGSAGTGLLEYALNTHAFQSDNQFAGLGAGDYLASVKDDLGCSTNQTVHLSLINNLMVNAGRDTTVCEGSLFNLSGSTNASGFSWTPSAGLDDAGLLQTKGRASTSTDFTLKVSQGLCTASAVVHVLVNAAPHPDAGVDSFVCAGRSTRLHGSGGITYQWHPGNFLSDPTTADPLVERPEQTTTYSLTVTDANHCNSIQDGTVTVHVISTDGLFAGHDTVMARNQPLQLNARDLNNSGFIQYQWSPATGLNDPYSADPVAHISQDITYHLKALTPNGCVGETSIGIKLYTGPEIYVPNAFSPNHDGHNDILRPFSVGISVFRYFAVYNRLGQRVFYSENAADGWDGNWKGSPQENGGFIWMAAGVDYQGRLLSRRGSVLLIR
jgi:gliding motility-associated-like protein